MMNKNYVLFMAGFLSLATAVFAAEKMYREVQEQLTSCKKNMDGVMPAGAKEVRIEPLKTVISQLCAIIPKDLIANFTALERELESAAAQAAGTLGATKESQRQQLKEKQEKLQADLEAAKKAQTTALTDAINDSMIPIYWEIETILMKMVEAIPGAPVWEVDMSSKSVTIKRDFENRTQFKSVEVPMVTVGPKFLVPPINYALFNLYRDLYQEFINTVMKVVESIGRRTRSSRSVDSIMAVLRGQVNAFSTMEFSRIVEFSTRKAAVAELEQRATKAQAILDAIDRFNDRRKEAIARKQKRDRARAAAEAAMMAK